MPTYTYYCEEHGEFEEVHSITQQLEECPKCIDEGKEPKKVIRLISGGGGFILTGGGWARDSYS